MARWRRQCGRLRGCFGVLRRCARGPSESKRVSRCEEGRTGEVGNEGNWKRRMGPGAEHRRVGLENEPGTGTWLKGSAESLGWSLPDQGKALRGRASPDPYAQELVSHTAYRSEWAMKIQRSGLERWLAQQLSLLIVSPGFGYQHPHGASQPSVTPLPRDPKPSSDLHGHQACL